VNKRPLLAIPLLLASLALHASAQAPATPRAAASPARPGPNTVRKTEQIRGFSIQLFGSTQAETDAYLKAIDDLADMGCSWVNFSIAARQDNVHSESIAIVWENIPSLPNLQRIIRKAKSRNMGVMLMPIVLLNNSGSKDWRGVILPPSWDNWFAQYTDFITKMAHLAHDCDVDVFCVGSELLSTETFRDKWIDVIGQIRKEFKGKLTYSANWDHYHVVSFWDQLDYIGMNNYNELASRPGAPLKDLLKAWEPIKRDILAFAAKQKKPFMFTEVGWHNLDNTIPEPWNYVATGAIDYDEQARAFESFVQTWTGVPNKEFMGAFVWEWRPGGKPTDHGSYSLQGTPSLEIVRRWMTSP
jgi:hypothetical protein